MRKSSVAAFVGGMVISVASAKVAKHLKEVIKEERARAERIKCYRCEYNSNCERIKEVAKM